MIRVAVTGGIGSGKSTVCRLFAGLGVPVYDSDLRARELMNEDRELRTRISAAFGPDSYRDGTLDRRYLAESVFGDPQRLAQLDAIVHPAVFADFERWVSEQSGDYVVLECAILFESGMDRCVDRVVAVVAPESLRVERASRRDGVSADRIRRRMAAQMSDDELCARADYTIVNIDRADLPNAVELCDRRFRYEAGK